MSDILGLVVYQVVYNYAQQMGILKPKLTVSEGSKNGDSYSGEVYRVIITSDGLEQDHTNNNNNENTVHAIEYRLLQIDSVRPSKLRLIIRTILLTPLSEDLRLIAKIPPKSEIRRQMYNSVRHFGREQYVFEKLLPAFEQFQLKHLNENEIFCNYPNMILASSETQNEFIILNDLSSSGYTNMDRPTPLSFDKCVSVVTNLAKLHAISFAFKEQNPVTFENLVEPLTEILFVEPIDKEFKAFLKNNLGYSLTTLDKSLDKEVIEKLLEFSDIFAEFMAQCCYEREDAVVLHGDCWISNILFKDNITNVEVNFLDWQVCRYGSVGIDLSYFIFCCTDSDLRLRFNDILVIYHTALLQRLNELGCDGSRIFSYEKLLWHMKKYSRFGLGMALMTLHATCCNTEDLVDVQTALNENDFTNLQDFADQKMIENPVYKKRMAGVCRDLYRLGYL